MIYGYSAYPDPTLTANLYCAGDLDNLVRFVVKDFWDEIRAPHPGRPDYLWLFRYGRCGEHLKIRIHAPPEEVPRMKEVLRKAADEYFARLPNPEAPAVRSRRDVPPIDREDASLDDYPDRVLLWTHYVRSPVSLGANPLLLDDTYAVLFTRCLGMACEFILSQLEINASLPDEGFPHRFRQSTLLKLVLSALTLSGFASEEHASYLAYHRDWLIRGLLVQKRHVWREESDILQRLEERTARPDSGMKVIAELAKRRWKGLVPETIPELARWQEAVGDLTRYVADQPRELESLFDPFAENLTFPLVFKVLHVAANQVGLKKLDEALAYHLLLRAIRGEEAGIGAIRRIPFLMPRAHGHQGVMGE